MTFINNLKKGLFAVKDNADSNINYSAQPPDKKDQITYNEYGFLQASKLGGTEPGLTTCLHKIYLDYKQEIKDNNVKQEELKKPFRVKIEDHKGNVVRLEKKIEKIKTENISTVKKKIIEFKGELSHIKKNPQEVTGDESGRTSFYVGGIILSFLTVYLFIFYSSASYSAFFKEFSLNEIGVANSIFDAKALTKALHDGLTELLLILTIPFVFLGLGYLIHKFQEQENLIKYVKILLLIVVTFIFDAILAYEITEKIYNIKKDNSFTEIPPYTIKMAVQSISFWLIIFAGFVVYLIWGFVFDFVMEAHAKMDKVNVALKEKTKQINESEKELKDLENQIDKMTHVVDDHNKEINKLNTILQGTIIPKEFQQEIFNFLSGWLTWMKQSGKITEELERASEITHDFVKITHNNLDTIKDA